MKKNHSLYPKITTILVGDNPASKLYVNNKIKTAHSIGIDAELTHMDSDIPTQELEEKIDLLNADRNANGILVQLPLPKHIDQNLIMDKISPDKDVDGFHVHNVGMLNAWRKCLKPCTPQSILAILHSVYGKDLTGKKAVVIGRSAIVGRPMASMLIQEDCTVSVIHSKTIDPIPECNKADILISAAGNPQMVKKNWVKNEACVIDVGITRKNGKLFGDVHFDEVKKIAKYITPVPGGVGPMTIAYLLKNTLEACCNQNQLNFETFYAKAKN